MAIEVITKTNGFDHANELISTNLDGIGYDLDFAWNQSDQRFYLDIFTEEGTPVACSLKVVFGIDLLANVSSDLAPVGVLTILDMEEEFGSIPCDPSIETFGTETRHRLIYLDAEELGLEIV